MSNPVKIPFFFDTNTAWGQVDTEEDWRKIVKAMCDLNGGDRAREILAFAMQCEDKVNFGSRAEHRGGKLLDWLRENDMQNLIDIMEEELCQRKKIVAVFSCLDEHYRYCDIGGIYLFSLPPNKEAYKIIDSFKSKRRQEDEISECFFGLYINDDLSLKGEGIDKDTEIVIGGKEYSPDLWQSIDSFHSPFWLRVFTVMDADDLASILMMAMSSEAGIEFCKLPEMEALWNDATIFTGDILMEMVERHNTALVNTRKPEEL